MSRSTLELRVPQPNAPWTQEQLDKVNRCLERIQAVERVQWGLNYLPRNPVLTSSFGAQSAVMLHLVTQHAPDIPVVLIDTGYLFEETYQFVDRLVERLGLDLRVYRPRTSAAWQEARHGKMWEKGAEGIQRYNRMNKIEPMERAISELEVGTWFSGIRRRQSDSRRGVSVLQAHGPVTKVHPLADWSNRDVHRYLKLNDLPYHPLWEQGYVSIGDHHTSRPLSAGLEAQDTRFFGLVRECGLHEADNFTGGAG